MQPTSPSQYLITAPDNELVVPPLDTERFDGSFGHFCSVKRLVLDRELLRVGGSRVDLHSLHAEVMENRGYDIREVRDYSRNVRLSGLTRHFSESARVLGEDRQGTWVHPVTRRGVHLFRGSGSIGYDL